MLEIEVFFILELICFYRCRIDFDMIALDYYWFCHQNWFWS